MSSTQTNGYMTKLLNVMSACHRGQANGIHGKHLAAKLGLEGDHGMRLMRKAISDLRESGVAIAGMPETGYFIATTADELNDFCIRFLEARALHSLKLSSRLRKIPLAQLCGQLLLNQA